MVCGVGLYPLVTAAFAVMNMAVLASNGNERIP
jgi:hypothetical protein